MIIQEECHEILWMVIFIVHRLKPPQTNVVDCSENILKLEMNIGKIFEVSVSNKWWNAIHQVWDNSDGSFAIIALV